MDVGVLGVVGAGRMGLALARLLKPAGLEFVFHDSNPGALARAEGEGYRVAGSLRGLLGEADAVMIAVGHDSVQEVIVRVGGLLRESPGARVRLVFDVSTFKDGILGLYAQYPDHLMVASVHPLFGPGARDPGRHTVAVIPVPGREEGSRAAAELFRRAGFRVELASLEEHEEAVAYTIGLTYALAAALPAALRGSWGRALRLSGTTFKLLLTMTGAVASDSEDFIAHVLSNPRVARAVGELAEALRSTTRDPRAHARLLKEVAGPESPRHYRAMYDCLEGRQA